MEWQRAGIAALVFDFDGTLARQTIDYAEMKREALAAARQHVPVPDVPGLPTMEILAHIDTATAPGAAGMAAALAAIARVEVEAARSSGLFFFVRPMLERLRALDIRMGIITRNCRAAVLAVFPDAETHTVLLTRDDVPRIKPDPVHLLLALERLGVTAKATLMVGDHPMDIAVGKNVGALTAGVATGHHDTTALAACEPDYLAPNGEALLRRLDVI